MIDDRTDRVTPGHLPDAARRNGLLDNRITIEHAATRILRRATHVDLRSGLPGRVPRDAPRAATRHTTGRIEGTMREQTISNVVDGTGRMTDDAFHTVAVAIMDRADALLTQAGEIMERDPGRTYKALPLAETTGALVAGALGYSAAEMLNALYVASVYQFGTRDGETSPRYAQENLHFGLLSQRVDQMVQRAEKLGIGQVSHTIRDRIRSLGERSDLTRIIAEAVGRGAKPRRATRVPGFVPAIVTDDGSEPIN